MGETWKKHGCKFLISWRIVSNIGFDFLGLVVVWQQGKVTSTMIGKLAYDKQKAHDKYIDYNPLQFLSIYDQKKFQ